MNSNQSHIEQQTKEKAWYFTKGDAVPEWLERGENCKLSFGVDVVVTSKNGGYEIRPYQKMKDGEGLLHLTPTNENRPHIYGGGKGVIIIGYDHGLDETYALEPSAARELALEEAVRKHLKWFERFICDQDELNSSTPRKVAQNAQDAAAELRAALSSPDHAGAFPQSKNEGRLSELNVEPGEVFERISGHDRHSDNLIGAKYISKDTGPYCQRGLHLERIPSGTGWTTMDDRGIFRRLSCDAGKVEGDGWLPIESAPKDGTIVLLGWNDPDIEEIGAVAGWYEGGPADRCWYDQYHEPVTATHWMPLRPFPAAPASEGAE